MILNYFFLFDQIAGLIPNGFYLHWPNLKQPNYLDFWVSQYDKHGTCCIPKFQIQQYFQLCLDIKLRIDLLQLLGTAGIMPHPTRQYTVNDFVNAIKPAIGNAFPTIVCNGWSDKSFLREIRLCLDSDGNQYINCPSLSYSCNRNLVILPPF